jgi:hypothetical protein
MLISTRSHRTGLHVFRSLYRQKYFAFGKFSRQLSQHPLLANNLLVISDEIRYSNKPVVALESTIVTHGLPYPQNLETALQVEAEIRALDVLPATIGKSHLRRLWHQLLVALTQTHIQADRQTAQKCPSLF